MEIFHAPVDRFVAAFMGEADFLAASTTRADFGSEALHGVDDETVVVLRPDDVTFSTDPDGRSRVVAAEFRGSTWYYTLQLPSGSEVHATRSHLVHVPVGTVVTVAITDGHHPTTLPS